MSKGVDEHIGYNADFSVLAEAEDWIAVSKAAPLIVHPANGRIEPSLLSGLESLLCFELANGATLSLINRLDRETSGVSLIAKNTATARQLGIAMQNREMHKTYTAIVHGHPMWSLLECHDPILRQGEVAESRIWVKQCVHPMGKPCSTTFTVLERISKNNKQFSLIKCEPITGRMHQLRVHLSHLGHPIVGDKIYGLNEECYLRFIEQGWTQDLEHELLMRRHALHAEILQFPFNDQYFHVTAPFPQDMRDMLA